MASLPLPAIFHQKSSAILTVVDYTVRGSLGLVLEVREGLSSSSSTSDPGYFLFNFYFPNNQPEQEKVLDFIER
jgi:hypothetical protein